MAWPAVRGATNDSPSSARCASGYGPVARASEGAAEECRSEARNARDNRCHLSMKVRFAKRDERLSSQRPLREHNPIRMGEAPVKYELAGAS